MNMPRLFTRRNIIIGILVTAGIIIFLAYYTFLGFSKSMKQAQWENRSLQSLKALEGIMDNMQDIETGQRGYIISHDTLFLLPYKESLQKLQSDTSLVLQIITRYPERSAEYRKLLLYVKDKVNHAITTVSQVGQGEYELASANTRSGIGRQIMDSIRAIIFRLEQEDRNILYESGNSRQVNARRSFRFLLVISLVLLSALIWLVWKLLIEEKTRRNNEKQIRYLARLSEQSSDAIFSTDNKGIILSWNKGAENIFGYTAEEAIGKYAPAITRSGRTEAETQQIVSEMNAAGSLSKESKVYSKDGREIYCLGSVTQLTNEEDEPAGVVVILRDITERKLNEKLLSQFNAELSGQVREKTEVIRSIVERIRDGFYSLNNNREFTYINDYAAEIMNSTVEQLTGKCIWEVLPEAVNSPAYELIESGFRDLQPVEKDIYYQPFNNWYAITVYPSVSGVSVYFKNITNQKIAEDALIHSNERFDLISRTTNDAIWEWDLETGKLWGNDMHQLLYGLSPEDPVPTEEEWLLRIHPEDRDKMRLRQQTSLDSEKNIFISEYRFNSTNNGYRNIYDRCYIVRNQEGKAIRMLGSMLDLTEQKKAEAKIRESEALYRALLEQAVEALVVIDMATGQFISVSDSAVSMFKMSREELQKRNPADMSPLHQPDGSLSTEAAANWIAKSIAGEKPVFEWVHTDSEGTPFLCEVNLVRLPAEDRVLIRGSIVNINEKKKAELALKDSEETRRLIMNSAMDAIVCINMEGLVTVWTPQAETIFGWKADQVMGQSLTDTIIPEKYRDAHRNGLKRYLETGVGRVLNRLLDLTAVKINGEEFPIEMSIVPVHRKENSFFCAFIRDITHRKKAEQDLRDSETKILHILSSSADDFYVIDHQFKVTLINKSAQRNMKDIWDNEVNEGTYILDIFPDHRKAFIRENYERVFKGERVEYEFTVEIRGIPHWRRVTYSPVRDATGQITGAFISTTDITEKKKAEESIMKTNARFQILSKATSDMVWDLNLEDKGLWWNDNYYTLLGYKKYKELVSLDDWFGNIHPEERERVYRSFMSTIEGRDSSWREEYQYRKADGSYLNVLDRGYIMRNEHGKAFRMIGSMVDMTPIYQVQKKIIESENRLRTILDTNPECIKLMDRDCRLLDINRAGLEMVGADQYADILGQSILQVVAAPYREKAADLVRRAGEGEKSRMEFQMNTLNGKVRWCEVSIVPFRNAGGEIVSILGVTIDITERKNAESELARNEVKYRTLVEQAADAILLFEDGGRLVDVNSGAISLLGYSKDELLTMKMQDMLTSEENRYNPFQFELMTQGSSKVRQRQMLKKDGSVVTTEVRSQQLPDGRYLSVIRDLTERIKAEQELQHYYNQLKELNIYLQNVREDERTGIAREIHDELGQQLTVLKMDISWLTKKLDTDKPEIREKLDGLIEMVDNTVKSVRRISSELRPSLLDDLGLPAAIEWHAQEFMKRTGLVIETDIEQKEVPLPGKLAITLFRVFQESLTNVARHANASKIHVSLKMEQHRLLMEVVDNGQGFLPGDIESKKTLGILGMKERIAIIKGEYDIQSSPGKGTRVKVSVPLQDM